MAEAVVVVTGFHKDMELHPLVLALIPALLEVI